MEPPVLVSLMMWCRALLLAIAGVPAGGTAGTQEHMGEFAREPFQVLITGFGPFLNFTSNPTEAVVRALGSRCLPVAIRPEPGWLDPAATTTFDICWKSVVLPVDRSGAVWTTNHLEQVLREAGRLPYHAIFHLGLENAEKGMKLEVAATNVRAVDGNSSVQPAVPGAQSLLATTVNTGWLSLARLQAANPDADFFAGLEELWSRDPGTFYCNEVYFRTLHFIRGMSLTASTGALLPAMFVHCPNVSVSSVESDIEIVSQIVGHALWSTYLAPGAERGILPAADSAMVAAEARGGMALTWAIFLVVALASSNLYLLALLRRRPLREPLLGST